WWWNSGARQEVEAAHKVLASAELELVNQTPSDVEAVFDGGASRGVASFRRPLRQTLTPEVDHDVEFRVPGVAVHARVHLAPGYTLVLPPIRRVEPWPSAPDEVAIVLSAELAFIREYIEDEKDR